MLLVMREACLDDTYSNPTTTCTAMSCVLCPTPTESLPGLHCADRAPTFRPLLFTCGGSQSQSTTIYANALRTSTICPQPPLLVLSTIDSSTTTRLVPFSYITHTSFWQFGDAHGERLLLPMSARPYLHTGFVNSMMLVRTSPAHTVYLERATTFVAAAPFFAALFPGPLPPSSAPSTPALSQSGPAVSSTCCVVAGSLCGGAGGFAVSSRDSFRIT
jgi:hypothetical protein